MKDARKIDPAHRQIQGLLRTVGPVVLGLGVAFTAVGLIGFFRAFGSFEPPRYFWCAFVGMPLIAIGSGMSKLGYLGAFSRYVMGEVAPVQKDTFNVLAEGVSPGVESLARAVRHGLSGEREAESVQESQCPDCAASCDPTARFCSQCGGSLEKKACPGCGQSYERDDKFCDQCGHRLD